ncbi:hypothetical protein SAMD00019534_015670, partial [Acytostelium subglobosum LB1]|uniref:hypothetical protein n=1 Tax=Acytostelium subglobosum LB1 TaxID=1410327 RepID=UPI000644AF57
MYSYMVNYREEERFDRYNRKDRMMYNKVVNQIGYSPQEIRGFQVQKQTMEQQNKQLLELMDVANERSRELPPNRKSLSPTSSFNLSVQQQDNSGGYYPPTPTTSPTSSLGGGGGGRVQSQGQVQTNDIDLLSEILSPSIQQQSFNQYSFNQQQQAQTFQYQQTLQQQCDIIPPIGNEHRHQYHITYNSITRNDSHKVPGHSARTLFQNAGLSTDCLANIWTQCDLDRDGHLDRDEFILMMHLINAVKSGYSLPAVLPAHLIPASKFSCFGSSISMPC